MSRRDTLPVMVGHNTRTGIMVLDHKGSMGGKTMFIVGLKKKLEKGESFEKEDIDRIKAVLHFLDPSSMRMMADMLNSTAENWEREERCQSGYPESK